MFDRLTRTMSWYSFHRPLVVVSVAVLLAIVSATVSNRYLRWNANPDELAARGSKYQQDYGRYIEEFGDIDCIYLVVDAKGNSDRAKACIDDLERRLLSVKDLDGVYASVNPDDQLRIATRKMSDSELKNFRDASGAFSAILSGEGPGRLLKDARLNINQLIASGFEGFVANDQSRAQLEQRQNELGTSAFFLLNTLAGALPDSASRKTLEPLLRDHDDTQYLQAKGSDLFFIRLLPRKDYKSLAVIDKPLRAVRQVIADVQVRFQDVEIGLTGKDVLLADQMHIASRDMGIATGLSVVLVLLAFIVVSRNFARPFMATVCLGLGMSWTFGLTTLCVGELSLISAAFAPILVGLGIEFGIHVVTRYHEERRHASAELALRRALLAVGRGNMTGALATCAAFSTALLTRSPGFSQLGFIAGTGVILCMLALTIVLPAMMVIYERMQRESILPKRMWTLTTPAFRRSPGRWFLPVCGLTTVFLACAMLRVSFRDNVLELQPPDLSSVHWEERVLASSNSTLFTSMMADDIPTVARLVDQTKNLSSVAEVHSVLDAIETPTPKRESWREALEGIDVKPSGRRSASPSGESFSSVARILASLEPETRKRSPAAADQMNQLARDLERLGAALSSPDRAFAERTRHQVDEFGQRVAQSLRLMLSGNQMPLRDALPDSVRELLMSRGGKFLVMVHPKKNIWEFKNLEEFVGQLRTVDEKVTGFPVIHLGTVNDLKTSFYVSSVLAFLVVSLLVWFDLGNVRDTCLAIVPLVVALTWTVGFMGLVGLDFNLVNFIAIPLLLGASVDQGVHMIHRIREHAHGDGFGSTSGAVVLTSLTTMFGFGSLIVSEHRGAQSLGIIMVLGAAMMMAASLVMLPLMLPLRQSPADPDIKPIRRAA